MNATLARVPSFHFTTNQKFPHLLATYPTTPPPTGLIEPGLIHRIIACTNHFNRLVSLDITQLSKLQGEQNTN
jgi:hypothetical protein